MNAVEHRYVNPHHEYEDVDYVSNYSSRRLKRNFSICVLYTSLLTLLGLGLIRLQGGTTTLVQPKLANDVHKVMHITDPHIDIFFNSEESVPNGGCHSCALAIFDSSSPYSTNISQNCPSERDVKQRIASSRQATRMSWSGQDSYTFGRYGCDPPLRLWSSLLDALQQVDSFPEVIVFTGESMSFIRSVSSFCGDCLLHILFLKSCR